MSYNLIIIAITCVISFMAFSNSQLLEKLMFYPYIMNGRSNEYYRFVSHGFVHASTQHLFFNMFTLWQFGTYLERQFSGTEYLLFFVLAIVVSSLSDFKEKKNDGYYRSLGASGGVSAVVFATILYQPWLQIWMIPGFIFGVGYLAYSFYASKKNADNIGHMAHIMGALFGIAYTLLAKQGVLTNFIEQITHPRNFIG